MIQHYVERRGMYVPVSAGRSDDAFVFIRPIIFLDSVFRHISLAQGMRLDGGREGIRYAYYLVIMIMIMNKQTINFTRSLALLIDREPIENERGGLLHSISSSSSSFIPSYQMLVTIEKNDGAPPKSMERRRLLDWLAD